MKKNNFIKITISYALISVFVLVLLILVQPNITKSDVTVNQKSLVDNSQFNISTSSDSSIKKVDSQVDCSDVTALLQNGELLTKMEQQVVDLQNSISNKTTQISSLTSAGVTKDSQIETLKSASDTKTTQISALQTRINNLTSAYNTKTIQISTLSSTISSLQSQLTTFGNNNSDSAQFLREYPVGSLYISTDSTNPGNKWGGSWSAYAQGRVLVGVGTGCDTNGTCWGFSAGQTGGEFTHRITVSELPYHRHTTTTRGAGVILKWDNAKNSSGVYWGAETWNGNYGSGGAYALNGMYTSYTGGDVYHNNTMPFVAVYIWYRNS